MKRNYNNALRCTRGATLVEFAIIMPVLMVMLCGALDLAHLAYVKAVLEGTVERAGRDSTLESGSTVAAGTAMDDAIIAEVRNVAGARATFAVPPRRSSYSDFSRVNQPERFVDKTPFNGRHDAGECYEDENGNAQWDADMGRSGQGGANDVVLYRLTVTYPRLFPMAGLLGWSNDQTVSATTILRNQPYSNQQRPPVTRCP